MFYLVKNLGVQNRGVAVENDPEPIRLAPCEILLQHPAARIVAHQIGDQLPEPIALDHLGPRFVAFPGEIAQSKIPIAEHHRQFRLRNMVFSEQMPQAGVWVK